jgi:DNA-binding response OmpR family regulator
MKELTRSLQGAIECQGLQTNILAKTASRKIEKKNDVKRMLSGLKEIRTLVVDPEDDVFLMARDSLNEINGTLFVARKANSAEEAKRMCEAEPFQVVMVLVQDGELESLPKLIRELRRKTGNAPVIAYSRDGSHSHDSVALDAGASDFLSAEELTACKLEKSVRYCLRNSR